MLDTKISGGKIVDGSGRPRYDGDIGIKDGRIVALGRVDQSAHKTIEAHGKVVAPGFVDIHTHYDAQVFWDPTLSPSCYHGVTTIFGGFCGFSIAPLSKESASYVRPMLARVEGMPLQSLEQGVPWNWSSFADYLQRIEGTLAINAGFLVGHSTVRRYIMGPRAVGERATDEELVAMKELVRQSIRGGALGFSTTLSKSHNDADGQPVPSRHATLREVLELASVVSEFGGTCAEILPGPSMEFTSEIYELLTQFSLAAKRPVNWNALLLNSLNASEIARVRRQLSATDYARARGAEVIALTIPVTPTVRVNLATGFMFDALPGWEHLFKIAIADRIETLKEPQARKTLKSVEPSVLGAMGWMAMWNEYKIEQVFSHQNKLFEGRVLGDIAAEMGGAHALDVLIDIALADDLETIFNPPLSANDSEALYRARAKLWQDDRTVIGASDAGAHLDILDTFAMSTKLLSLAVRGYNLISLEDAVYNLTHKPAKLMGLKERGLLQPGWFADIVIFDPDRVGMGKVHVRKDLPAGSSRMYADAEGINHVMVNGSEIIANGRYLGAPAGVILKPGRNTYTVKIPAGY
jgi:N-acyl-D-aspartate/D-glutamate deacylase